MQVRHHHSALEYRFVEISNELVLLGLLGTPQSGGRVRTPEHTVTSQNVTYTAGIAFGKLDASVNKLGEVSGIIV